MSTGSHVERHEITSVHDLLPHLSGSQDETVGPLYRGHGDGRWELAPGLFRWHKKPVLSASWRNFEAKLLESFWLRAVAITPKPTDPAHQLAIAQHHGLPTRLLDWSRNPLASLAFAVAADASTAEYEGCLWEIRTSATWSGKLKDVDPLEDVGHVVKFFPPHMSPRIIAQHGCFTVHALPEGNAPFVPLERRFLEGQAGLRLRRFDIPASKKQRIRHQLANLGWTPATLYPDLDGFAKDAVASMNRALEIEAGN